MKNEKIIIGLISTVVSILSIYILLITSFELAIYGDFNYYRELYEKYDVEKDLNMEMEDIMDVTTEMMLYLRGERPDLNVETKVDGKTQMFFNEREIYHMEDVRDMFVINMNLRNIGILVVGGLMFFMIMMKYDWKLQHTKIFQYTTIGFVLVIGVLGALFALNFQKSFEVFHLIFFEGDTWLFDPTTSLMINMLPQGLFYDFTMRTVAIFAAIMGLLLILSINFRVKLGTEKRK